MILYDYVLAYNPAKARLALAEKRIPYVRKHVDLFNGQSLSPSFLKLQPGGTVPVLEDGGKRIGETIDVLNYVNEYGGKPLGGTEVDQAAVKCWTHKLHAWDGNLFATTSSDKNTRQIMSFIGQYRRRYAEARKRENPDLAAVYDAKLAAMKASEQEAADTAKVEANRKELSSLMAEADEALGKTKFIAGDEYSLADVVLTCMLYRIHMVHKEKYYVEPHPQVKAYYSRVRQRPSWSTVFGPQESNLTKLAVVLPALLKAQFCSLTGWY
mmetsp:Transcript_14011/g.30314  ORF Transcript_14011/g.30314 Transcript_14011/m.30314 type:complete len:269 (+) Transcript_14011:173-979(+)|eukprot:CAMPEP_0202903142 /NCGR_PEP_ID=MMETSP1392-20130828/22076_1 /ASSEMBLY_ACC=CAM_ASM_000868 /TAXON_ID=225041 /ORGANISM="Chlamydomonas chlamydogama, Strain SAG 11-48b" /LENGTH=268 /DNA_ID=CAMNT_0049590151 /DNA_START=105 /DNA_END=911 /DNA_ORIENTATION=+